MMKAAAVKSYKKNETRAAAYSLFQKKSSQKAAVGFAYNRTRTAPGYLKSVPSDPAATSEAIRLYEPSPVPYPPTLQLRLAEGAEAFIEEFPVAKELVQGINHEQKDAVILQQLMNKFKTIGFTYTMQSKHEDKLLKGTKEGDCQTLARAFKKVAERYFGIEGIEIKSITTPFLANVGATPYAGKKPNCDKGAKWFFQNHYWAKAGGVDYDILFLTNDIAGPDKATTQTPKKWIIMPEQEYYETESGKTVYPYGDVYFSTPMWKISYLWYLVKNGFWNLLGWIFGKLWATKDWIIEAIRNNLISTTRDNSLAELVERGRERHEKKD